ncbi:major facilitator superfamily domain-containing protein [Fennellomyces sp. T-0311]|nr:major facilitator superfamily domain-containing protein [Fennellomyces sp. T-0311]
MDIDEDSSNDDSGPAPPKTRVEIIRFFTLIAALGLSTFIVALNSTVVAPALSIIATELEALEKQTWIATAYMVALNTSQPLAGKFSDIFGRKPIYLFGQVFLLVGSIVSATTPSIEGLIAGRTVQGFGAGSIMSMAFIIITDIAPLYWRPRVQSVLVVLFGLASVVGPLIGGAFVDQVSWRWDFWLTTILNGVAILIILFVFRETVALQRQSMMDKIKRIDFLGALFSVGFVTCLLLALNWGPPYGWNDKHVIASFVACGVALIALIFVEGWVAKEPLMPPEVMLDPKVFIIYFYMVLLGFGFIGTMFFGPILFQTVFGASSIESSVRLIPFMVCLMAGSISSSIFMRYFPYVKFYILTGAAASTLGYGLFQLVDENSSWGMQAGLLTFSGLAVGLSQQNCVLGVQAAAKQKYMAVATSLTNFFMLLGSAMGVAIYQVLFITFAKNELGLVDPRILMVAKQYGALDNYLYVYRVPSESRGPIVHAYMEALSKVFLLPVCAGGASIICSLLMRNVRYGAPEGKVLPRKASQDMDDSATA